MTKSLNIQKTPKKSACEPQTFECLRAFNNAPCDYYFKIFSQCLYQGIHGCWNTQAWPKRLNVKGDYYVFSSYER